MPIRNTDAAWACVSQEGNSAVSEALATGELLCPWQVEHQAAEACPTCQDTNGAVGSVRTTLFATSFLAFGRNPMDWTNAVQESNEPETKDKVVGCKGQVIWSKLVSHSKGVEKGRCEVLLAQEELAPLQLGPQHLALLLSSSKGLAILLGPAHQIGHHQPDRTIWYIFEDLVASLTKCQ